MFREILAVVGLVTAPAAAQEPIPLDGPNGAVAVDELRLVLRSGETVDLAPLVGTQDEEWRVQSVSCFNDRCSAGFVALARVLDPRTGMLAGFDLSRNPSGHIIIDRGYDFTAQIARLSETSAVLLTRRSVRFARPGPCGTQACQALQRSLSLLARDDRGFWYPERPLRRFDTEAEDLRLFQRAVAEPTPAILETSTGSRLTWHRITAEGQSEPIQLPAGRILGTYADGFVVNANAQSDTPHDGALNLAYLPLRCLIAQCSAEDLTLIGSLAARTDARQLTVSRDGAVFVTEYEDGSAHLDQLVPSAPGGRNPIALPVERAGIVTSQHALSAGLTVSIETFEGVERLYALATDGEPSWALLIDRDKEPLARVESRLTESVDGVLVPWRRISPAGPEQACRPTMISAYGGFGLPTAPHSPRPMERAWLDAGGAVVIAHVRGDGAYGPDWVAAGEADRWRTVQDLEAIAQDLIESGQTHPNVLVLRGGSFGGLIALAASSKLTPPPAVTIASSTPVEVSASSFEFAISDQLNLTPAFAGTASPEVILTANGNDRRVPPQMAQVWRTLLNDAGSNVTVYEYANLPHTWRDIDHPTVTAAQEHLYRRIRAAITTRPNCAFNSQVDPEESAP